MSVLASLHDEHKARQLRIKRAALKELTTELKPPAPEPLPITQPEVVSNKSYNTSDTIINEVCRYFNVRREDVLSQRRLMGISYPRHVISYMFYLITDYTTPQIGKKLDRDATTVGYSIKKIKNEYEEFKAHIEALEPVLRGLIQKR